MRRSFRTALVALTAVAALLLPAAGASAGPERPSLCDFVANTHCDILD